MSSSDRPIAWFLIGGLCLSIWLSWRRMRGDQRLASIYFGGLSGALIGAKLVYVMAEGWRDFDEPDMWIRLATGKTIVGGLLGGYGGVELVKWAIGYQKTTGDYFGLVTPLSIALSRVGCWVNGCCLGHVCAKADWWTMTDRAGQPRWPAVPLEIAFNLIFAACLMVLRARKLAVGQHFHLYMISYGIFRFIHEWWRDTPKFLGWISGYQVAALALAGLGWWRYNQRARTCPEAPDLCL